MCASATASCRRAASCRRSATRSRIEHARAIGSKALGQAQAIVDAPSTTRPSATSSTPRTTCSRSCRRCSATPTRACRLVAAAMQTRGVRCRAARGARGRGRDDAHRAGRHAGARRRACRSRRRTPSPRACSRRGTRTRRPNCRRCSPPSASRRSGRPLPYTDEDLRRILSPRLLRAGPPHAGRTGAGGDRPGAGRLSSAARRRSRVAHRQARGTGRGRYACASSAPRHSDADAARIGLCARRPSPSSPSRRWC